MKTASAYRKGVTIVPAYPNAADRRYFLNKFLEGLLTAATITGFLVAILFFIFV